MSPYFFRVFALIGVLCSSRVQYNPNQHRTLQRPYFHLQQSNPSWNPPYSMKQRYLVFPEAKVYLCDFHQEQAWTRDHQHGPSTEEAEELPPQYQVSSFHWVPTKQQRRNYTRYSIQWYKVGSLQLWVHFLKFQEYKG